MALPDFIYNEVGTAISWKSSGGDYALTCTSVTNGNGRQGAKGDLGANRARIYDVYFTSAVASAATAGNTVDLYWAPSDSATSATDNPCGAITSNSIVTGADAAFSTTVSEYVPMLIFIGSLVLSNNAGTGVQGTWLSFVPPCRYGMPIVVNSSGQTLSSTAASHTVTLIPRKEGIEDT